jgi:hypothetical protein
MSAISTSPSTGTDAGKSGPAKLPGIVVAVDGSRSSFVTAEAAGRLADEWKVPVHLVSVLPPFADYGSHPEGDEPASQVEDLRVQLRDAAIRKMMERMHRTNEWSHEVVVGRIPAALVTAADKRGARVIFWPGKQ